MPSYERQTSVHAPLEAVWAFHSRVSGLEAVTPDWMGLCVESAIGPDGDPGPDVLEAGSEVTLSVRPFGVGPRQYWTSLITDRDRRDGTAYFRDEMVRGPFDRWVHTHAFYADGDRTIVRDHVEYDLSIEAIDRAVAPLTTVGFDAMFRYRHRATKARLESGPARHRTLEDPSLE
ncbi:SRPBCC family protein [Halopiger djelfimassiliensis]|uniref:SRPBCC family protein n=1 Tax=Halopiger djelfimassiliensis TaxID=1293047 RepID=UPI000677C643|nr:SRPBCC family protein [Halopiger djelfimassiliensis]